MKINAVEQIKYRKYRVSDHKSNYNIIILKKFFETTILNNLEKAT